MSSSSGNKRRKRQRKQEEREDATAWNELSAAVQQDIRSVVSTVQKQANNEAIEISTLLEQWAANAPESAPVLAPTTTTQIGTVAGPRQAELYLAHHVRRGEQVSLVFSLLDTDGKGCIVANDILRVARELGGEDAAMTQQEAMEMVEEFAAADSDGVLSLQDVIEIAAKVNL